MRRDSFFPAATIAALCFTAIASSPALADSPRTPPLRAPSMQQYGLANPDCVEWTNSCQICRRDAAGAAQCSTPGIACTPKGVTCTTRAARPAR